MVACLALVLAFTFAWPMQAYAFDDSCIQHILSSGLVVKMRTQIHFTDPPVYTEWTELFPIGQTRCQDISFVPSGIDFVAQVQAVLGDTKTCTPTVTQTDGSDAATWSVLGSDELMCQMFGN